jgi:alkylhydroperoxidase family enzyme
VGAHARNLQLQGQDEKEVDAIASGAVDLAKLPEKERLLMDYVRVLTLEPAKVSDEQVNGLRRAGWNDEQIFEASFVTALFAFFNRMADAYGLDYPANGWKPETLRGTPETPDAAPSPR